MQGEAQALLGLRERFLCRCGAFHQMLPFQRIGGESAIYQ